MAAHGRGMADRQVIAFHEVLGEHLPVRVPDMGLAEALDIVLHLIGGDQLFQRAKGRGDAGAVLVERDVDPAQPFLAADRGQGVVLLAEAGGLGHERRPSQAAVEVIGPGVIGADQHPLVAAASTSVDMRCRQTFEKARNWPSLPRRTTTGWPARS